jgi:hypothetical protein
MNVKKAAEVPGSAQSAVARRSAEAELRTLIGKFAPAHLRLIGAMRRSLRKRLPTAHEVMYEYRDNFVISYSPSEHGYEGVLAIRGSADSVKLYFNRGKELPDPAKLLQGRPGALHKRGGSIHTRSSRDRAPDRRGHRAQSSAVRARRPRVDDHSFDIGEEAAGESHRLTDSLPQK